MSDKITTLHPKNNLNVNIYPNVKDENIPDTIARKAGTDMSLSENLSVAGNTELTGTLKVEGSADLGSDLDVDGNLSVNNTDNISFKESSDTLTDKLDAKQDTLVAGDNITIDGNVISASGTELSEVENLSVTGTLTLPSASAISLTDGDAYVDLSSNQIITGQKEFHGTGTSTPHVFLNYEQSSDGIIVSYSSNPYQSGSFTGPLRVLINTAYIEITWAKGKERYMGTYRYDRYTYRPYSSGNATAFVFPISKSQGTYTLATTDDIPSVPTYYNHLIKVTLTSSSADFYLNIVTQSSTAITTASALAGAIYAKTGGGYYPIASPTSYGCINAITTSAVTISGYISGSSVSVPVTDDTATITDNVVEIS